MARLGHIPRRRVIIFVIILVLASALAIDRLVVQVTHRCTVTAVLEPTCGAWWGMYLTASRYDLVGAVTAEDAFLGRRLDIIERYHDMSLGADGVFPDNGERQLARNHLLLFSWSPIVWATDATYQWAAIAAGALDRAVIIPEAKRLHIFHRKVFLTFASEPDVAQNQGTAAAFVKAWQHIHDIFARLGVDNVVWVWTTDGYMSHIHRIAAMYPGDSYVDWIGYDPHNLYICQRTGWLPFAQTAGPFYRWLIDRGLGSKPIMLAEFASAPDPQHLDRQASWYRSIVSTLRQMPRIKALIQWNAYANGCDMRVNHTAETDRAYRQTGLSPYFNLTRLAPYLNKEAS